MITEQAQSILDAVQRRQRVGFAKPHLRDRTQILLEFFSQSLRAGLIPDFWPSGIWFTVVNQASSLVNGVSHTQSTRCQMSKMDGLNHLLWVPFPLHWFQRNLRNIRGDKPRIATLLKIPSRVGSEKYLKAERCCEGRSIYHIINIDTYPSYNLNSHLVTFLFLLCSFVSKFITQNFTNQVNLSNITFLNQLGIKTEFGWSWHFFKGNSLRTTLASSMRCLHMGKATYSSLCSQ